MRSTRRRRSKRADARHPARCRSSSRRLHATRPPASLFLWSAFSVILLLAGIALLGWHQAVTEGRHREPHELPATDPMSHEGGCKVFLDSAGDVPPADPARHDCLRGLKPDLVWSERLLKTSFWSFNIGLALMGLMTLLPIGTPQRNCWRRSTMATCMPVRPNSCSSP